VSASQRRVPVRYFSLMLGYLSAQGVDTAGLLNMAQIEPARFEHSDGVLLPKEVDALVVTAHQLTGRTDIGFEVGRLIKLNAHDQLGYALLSCSNLDHMLQLASRHYHFINELFTMRYRRWLDRGEVVFSPVVAMPVQTMRFAMEMIAVSVQAQFQMLFAPDTPAYEVRMAMPPPAHHARYSRLLPVRFHFDEQALPGITMLLDGPLLDHPLPMALPRVVEQFEERVQTLRHRPVPDAGWGEYIAMMLREVHGQQVTLEDIARRMNISARTIDRNLKKEHLQFRDLSQQVRFERAQKLLAQAQVTVAQVAEQLGFSDPANFGRAFRRHAGMTPGEYQQRAASRRGA